MLKAEGIIKVEPHRGRIVLDVSNDFVELYYWFITRYYWIRMNRPMHGAHITIFNEKHHSKANWEKAVWYDKKKIDFTYDPYIIEGGYTKGFIMYYLRVFSKDLDKMKEKIGIGDGEGYKGLHITICNSKGTAIYPDWPKLIEIKEKMIP